MNFNKYSSQLLLAIEDGLSKLFMYDARGPKILRCISAQSSQINIPKVTEACVAKFDLQSKHTTLP